MPTKIEWTHRPGTTGESWNPIRAKRKDGTGRIGWHCTKVSAGCVNCYAEDFNMRLGTRLPYNGASRSLIDLCLDEEVLEKPLRWRKPRTVFVCSMTDLFHEDIPNEMICRIWLMMNRCQDHKFLVLTKRTERMVDWLSKSFGMNKFDPPPLPNVWLGVTAENDKCLKERWPMLADTPAAVRYLSVEPMLDDVFAEFEQGWKFPDWVIVGGESGSRARPMHPDWVRAAREFALCWGIPFFLKQWGEYRPAEAGEAANKFVTFIDRQGKDVSWPDADWYGRDDHTAMTRVGKKAAGRLLDGREWNEWPR